MPQILSSIQVIFVNSIADLQQTITDLVTSAIDMSSNANHFVTQTGNTKIMNVIKWIFLPDNANPTPGVSTQLPVSSLLSLIKFVSKVKINRGLQ
jgi:hypothetical protein